MSTPGRSVLGQLLSLTEQRMELLNKRNRLKVLLPILRDSKKELDRRLKSVGTGSFSNTQLRQIRTQINFVVEYLEKRLNAGLEDMTDGAMTKAANDFAVQLRLFETALGNKPLVGPVPVQQVAQLVGALPNSRSLLDEFHNRRQSVVKNYGREVVEKMEGVIAKGVLERKTSDTMTREMLDEFGDALGGTYWQAERIVRTEVSYAANRVHVDKAEKLLAAGMDDTLMRWVERVDDVSGQALDSRVAKDSLEMHGQLRLPGTSFYDPVNKRSVTSPPNRPNDRATIMVWRASWGEPPGGINRLDAESRAAWAEAVKNI